MKICKLCKGEVKSQSDLIKQHKDCVSYMIDHGEIDLSVI